MNLLRCIILQWAILVFAVLVNKALAGADSHYHVNILVSPLSSVNESLGEITVHIQDIKEKKGTLRIFLFNNESGFLKKPKEAFREVSITYFDQNTSYTFKEIPFGEYVIAIFQDIDEDDKLDKNFIGIPIEPIAMSNMKKMGIPSYKKSIVMLDQHAISLTLEFVND